MNIKTLALLVSMLIAGMAIPAQGQIVSTEKSSKQTADSIRNELDSRPYFSLYKDTYFVGGTVLGGEPTSHNSDVKFQISFQQRLTKSPLPWNSYLYLFYTQKALWNVFERSLPSWDKKNTITILLTNTITHKNIPS